MLAPICPSCGSTSPFVMGGSSPCRNAFHVSAGFPRDPSDNAAKETTMLRKLVMLAFLTLPCCAQTPAFWFSAAHTGQTVIFQRGIQYRMGDGARWCDVIPVYSATTIVLSGLGCTYQGKTINVSEVDVMETTRPQTITVDAQSVVVGATPAHGAVWWGQH